MKIEPKSYGLLSKHHGARHLQLNDWFQIFNRIYNYWLNLFDHKFYNFLEVVGSLEHLIHT
jgi:hypothetical protein